MERVPQELVPGGGSHVPSGARRGQPGGSKGSRSRHGAVGRCAVLAGCLVALTAGCIGTQPFKVLEDREHMPVHQIAATWENRVLYTPDPTKGGAPTPGLAGRLYLFGPEFGHPLLGDGSAVVDLYDDTAVPSGGKSRLLEKWILDKDTLKRLVRKDMVGQGYTLFLPWGTCKPEVNQVHLMVSYTPAKGNPLYAPSSTLTLNSDVPPPQVANRTVVSQGMMPAGPAGSPAPPVNPGPASPGVAQGPAPQQPYYAARWAGQGPPAVSAPAMPAQPQTAPAGMGVQRTSWPAPGPVPATLPPLQSPPLAQGPFPTGAVQPATWPPQNPVLPSQNPAVPAMNGPPATWPPSAPAPGSAPQFQSPAANGLPQSFAPPQPANGMPAAWPQATGPAGPAVSPQVQTPPAGMGAPPTGWPAPGVAPQPPGPLPAVNAQPLYWPR